MMRITFRGQTYDLSVRNDDTAVCQLDGKNIYDVFPFWIDPRFLEQFDADPDIPMDTYSELIAWLREPRVREEVQELGSATKNLILGHLREIVYIDGYHDTGDDAPDVEDTLHFKFDGIESMNLWRVDRVGRNGRSPRFNDFVLVDPPVPQDDEPVLRLAFTEGDYEFGFFWIAEPTTETGAEFPRELYSVMNYTFTPELNFMSMGKERTHMYMGMELEVSSVITATELQYIVTHVHPVQEPFFYMKHDTSISGRYSNLYEIVTHPMTPRRMRTEWRRLFIKIEKLAEAKGFRLSDIFDTRTDLTNGIHLHVSRDAFVMSHPGDNLHVNRFLTAFNQWDRSFQKWLQRISKRPYLPKDNEYCHVHPSFDGLTVARRLRRGSTTRARHSACHDTGRTIEVRVWQGIVDLKHILSCIDLTAAMFEFTQYVPRSSFSSPRFIQEFTTFVKKARGFRNAKEAIKQCA